MFKSLYKETEGFRLVSILTPLCMIGEVVMEMIIPKLMSSIIDDGVTAGNLSHIYRIGGWMIVAAAFGLLFGVLGGVFGARASTGYARNLRRSMYRNIQTFSFANIDKYSTAGLVTRMTTDVTNIQNAYQMILRMAIRAPSSMVIAMIMAFTINAKLASIYLVAVIILGGCLVLIMSRASNYFSAAFKKYDDLNESVQENVPPSAWSKRMCAKITRVKSSKKASGNVQDLLLRAEKVLSFNSPLMMATVYTCILLISWLGCPHDRAVRCYRLYHRRADEHADLLHQHPDQPDDAVHGVSHDVHVRRFPPSVLLKCWKKKAACPTVKTRLWKSRTALSALIMSASAIRPMAAMCCLIST